MAMSARQEGRTGGVARPVRNPQGAEPRRASLLSRLFVDHPRSLDMGWARHGAGAVRIGARLIGAGAACLVHAIVPGWFTMTAGRTVQSLAGEMERRKATSGRDDWPDYEI